MTIQRITQLMQVTVGLAPGRDCGSLGLELSGISEGTRLGFRVCAVGMGGVRGRQLGFCWLKLSGIVWGRGVETEGGGEVGEQEKPRVE